MTKPWEFLTFSLNYGTEELIHTEEGVYKNKKFPNLYSRDQCDVNKQEFYSWFSKELLPFKEYHDKSQIYYLWRAGIDLLKALKQCCKFDVFKSYLDLPIYKDINNAIKVFKVLEKNKIVVLPTGCIRVFNVDKSNKIACHEFIFQAGHMVGDFALLYSKSLPFSIYVHRVNWRDMPSEVHTLVKEFMPAEEHYLVQWRELPLSQLYELHKRLKNLCKLNEECYNYLAFCKSRIVLAKQLQKGLKMYDGKIPLTCNLTKKEHRKIAAQTLRDNIVKEINSSQYCSTMKAVRIYCAEVCKTNLIRNTPLYQKLSFLLKTSLKDSPGLTFEEIEKTFYSYNS